MALTFTVFGLGGYWLLVSSVILGLVAGLVQIAIETVLEQTDFSVFFFTESISCKKYRKPTRKCHQHSIIRYVRYTCIVLIIMDRLISTMAYSKPPINVDKTSNHSKVPTEVLMEPVKNIRYLI